jgi:protein FRA10AC1
MEQARDMAVIRSEYRFLRDSDDDDNIDPATKRFEEALFREYAIADVSRYREHLLGLRWRTADEVKSRKGVDICGARDCLQRNQLVTLEVPFAYVEHGERRRALVKVVLCDQHAEHLRLAKKIPEPDEHRDEKEKKKKKKKSKEKKAKKKKRERE